MSSDHAISQSKFLTKNRLLVMGIIVVIVIIGVLSFFLIFKDMFFKTGQGGKDSLLIANEYMNAISTGDSGSFYEYIPNESVNSNEVISAITSAYERNKAAGFSYNDDGQYKVLDSYVKSKIEQLKTTYGLKQIDEAKEVLYHATFKAVMEGDNVTGEEELSIITIRIGDSWFYLDAKDNVNRYKKNESDSWTDLVSTGSQSKWNEQ